MTITLQGLHAADTGRLIEVARHWDGVARSLDAAVEDLGRETRDLPHHWPAGPSSQAARDKLADLRVQLGNGYQHCAEIARIIRDFAGEIESHRRMLHGLVAEARSAGLRIDLAAGTITAPLEVAATQSTVDSYAQQIGEIVARAGEADRQAADRLDAHDYREQYLPNTDRPDYDEAAVLSLTGVQTTPETRAAWWQAQHPLVQDRAIVEHPEIIGAAVGLPAKDRDSANRLLMRREKEQLQAARAGHDQLHDGAMTQAQLDIDRRLAAITELEHRSQGQRILTYEPGLVSR